jgi:hypothetical protein
MSRSRCWRNSWAAFFALSQILYSKNPKFYWECFFSSFRTTREKDTLLCYIWWLIVLFRNRKSLPLSSESTLLLKHNSETRAVLSKSRYHFLFLALPYVFMAKQWRYCVELMIRLEALEGIDLIYSLPHPSHEGNRVIDVVMKLHL